MSEPWTSVSKLFAMTAIAGCAQMETLPPANSLPRYSDPDLTPSTAIISGSSTTFLFQTDRTWIQSVDGNSVALKKRISGRPLPSE